MARESTLDEFLGDAEGDDTGDPDTAPPDADAGDPDAAPAAVTYEWTPDGRACEACGATVRRRWLDGGMRVCADCKEW